MVKKVKKQSNIKLDADIGGVSLAQKAMLAKNLSIMLKSGLSLPEALTILLNSGINGRLRTIVFDLNRAVRAGSSFAEALGRYPDIFSGFFIGSVYAGEASGTLNDNLDKISIELTKERKLRSRILSSLAYPVVILFFASILVAFTSVFVLPNTLTMFQGMRVELPLLTRWLIALANFFSKHGTTFIISLFFSVIFLIWFLKLEKMKSFTHGLLLNTFIVQNIVRKTNLSNFFRIVGVMFESGLNIIEALNVAANTVSNYHFKKAVLIVKGGVEKGAKMSTMLARFPGLFPQMAIEMVGVAEDSGKLEDTLAYLADFYESQIDASTKNLALFIEIFLLLFIGLAVGFVAIAIIVPMYGITAHLGR